MYGKDNNTGTRHKIIPKLVKLERIARYHEEKAARKIVFEQLTLSPVRRFKQAVKEEESQWKVD